jgi:tetratricopeptide (TPR) repeat protein
MRKRLLFTEVIAALLLSTIVFADDSCWRTCQTEAEELCRTGAWGEAFQRAKLALKLARAQYGPRHLNFAKSLEGLGDICLAWGRSQQAEVFLNEALRIRRRIHGDCHPGVIKLLTMKADNFRMHRKGGQAERLYRQALDLADKGGWGESSHAGPSLEGLAKLLFYQGEYSRAEPLYRKAIAIYKTGEKYRPAEKLCVARCLIGLAEIKRAQKDFDGARELYETSMGKYSEVSGPGSPMIAFIYKRLADLYVDRRMPSLALTNFHRSLGAYERTGLPEGPLTASTLAGIANILKSQGKLARAKVLYNSAEEIYERTGGLDRELATMTLTKGRIWPSILQR